MYDFLELDKQVTMLKGTIDMAYSAHKESIKTEIRSFKNQKHCEKCKEVIEKRVELDQYLEKKKNKHKEETNQTIDKYIDQVRDSIFIELKQMLDAILIRNKLSNEHQKFIDKQLENVLTTRKKLYNKEDCEQEANKIWESLYKEILISLKNEDSTIDVKINVEVTEIRAYDYLDQVKKLKLSSYLDRNNITLIKEKINNMINQNLSGIDHFHTGIVHLWKISIRPKFKINVHAYALLNFIKKMITIQDKWDKENTPLGINIRLQYRHSHLSEGHIAGDFLLRAIHKKAIDAEYRDRINFLRGKAWINSSKTVRLKYFIELAEQVHNGDLNKGVLHFSVPRESIEKWFENKVNLDERTNQGQIYKETFDTEFDDVRQKIHNCKSYEDVEKFVNNYIVQVEGIEYQLNIKDNSITENFTLFREAIEKELDAEKELSIRGNALCCGLKEHDKDVGEYKFHHTSHQPPGLNGVSYRGIEKLTVKACHNKLDADYVYICDVRKKWKEAKTQNYPNWKFEPHCMNVFNDIMRWFFQMLQQNL
ncbi:1037_t:CDS:2 [Dentiscutata erythropus]|uniref:1037_t:CDS:1 n=1 Tax=Dentiscutata erythropus TaxID=1348616 RepID=A0A9N9DQZ2_9GLOM|nr:1037_t:CDS:2 [Dentiscutata erythropus]